MTNLQSLALSGTQLSGTIPVDALTTLTNLRTIFLAKTQFTGTIPDLSALTELRTLDLLDSQFSSINQDFSTLTNLQYLRLDSNLFTGPIPDLSELINLRNLSLQNNQFYGPIPNFSGLTNLQTLILSGNTELCKAPNTNYGQWTTTVSSFSECGICDTAVQMQKNQCETLIALYDSTDGDNWKRKTDWKQTNTPCGWEGIICNGDGYVTNISLYTNQLAGTLPDLSALTELLYVSLSGNQLTGSLPDLSASTNLHTLAVEHNQLSGPLSDLSALTQLKTLLQKLWLDNNDLSGQLPEISQFTNLQTLSLGGNDQLEGPIPTLPASLETLTLGGDLCQNPNADYGTLDVSSFLACDDANYGLVLHLPFDGNANDASGNGNDGTVNGATLTTDRHGNADSAYSFDGNDDFIQIADSDSLDIGYNDYTMVAWIKTSNTKNNGRIFSKGSSLCVTGYMMRMESSKIHLENAKDQNCHLALTGSDMVNNNAWHFVVSVVDRDVGAKIFIDGNLDSQIQLDTSAYDLSNNRDPMIGANDVGNVHEPFDGVIDDVRIYNRALSSSEIQSYYNSTKPTDCTTVTEIPTAQCETLVHCQGCIDG